MVADDQIRQIVQAVLTQLKVPKTSPMQPIPVTAPKPSANNLKGTKQVEEMIPLEDPVDMTEVEVPAMIDLQTEILVTQPHDRAALEFFKGATPARIGVWRTGPRPLTGTVLRFRADHAAAQDAVFSELDETLVEEFDLLLVQSLVTSKDEYLTRPDRGKKLAPESVEKIRRHCLTGIDVQIIVADGLSSKALPANLPHVMPALKQGLKANGLSSGKDILVRYGRVEIMDEIGMLVQAKVVVLLIGERPGLGTSESMSFYIVYQPHEGTLIADHTMVSNIRKGGMPPAEAGAHLADLIKKIYDARVSGVKLSV